MTVEPLIASVGDTGFKVFDLNVSPCPSVTVTGPTPPPGGGAGGLGVALLLGVAVLGIAMTSKK